MSKRTQMCEACKEEKPLTEFNAAVRGMKIWIDDTCIKCRMAGRKSLQELIEDSGKYGGKPRIKLPLSEIKELHKKGLGCKAIASRLRQSGTEVSHSTIYRRLSISEMGHL